MKTLVLGAGQVGASVAAALANENTDITVIDTDGAKLADLSDRLDIRTVTGHAALPSVLAQGGAEDTDLLIAVTSSDEVNLVACRIARQTFNIPTCVARLRQSDYLSYPELNSHELFHIDYAISPESLVCDYVSRLIDHPGALQVLDFADGRVQMVGVRAIAGGKLVGHEIRELKEHLPEQVKSRVAAIFRDGITIKPEGDTVIQVNDEVFFLTEQRHVEVVMSEMRKLDKQTKRVFIAGGGNIGMQLARSLEQRYNVKLLERSQSRARAIAEQLHDTIVLIGDCSDETLLSEENINRTDVYCALTNDDEANILSAMLAKRMGCARVIALINRPAYAALVQGGPIDIAISPQQITLSALLTHVRQGTMVKVHSLRNGAAEALEAIAMGNRRTSKVVGRMIDELDLPKSATIGGVVRGEEMLLPHHDLMIEENDHLIVFIANKVDLPKVEQLFQAAATWI